MEIKLKEITIRELTKNYIDNADNGVTGYDGKLNIRPAYQREFIYKDKQRDEVIKSVRNGFPLNVMYWVVSENGNYELLDGQQRTISICQYVNGDFSINARGFSNLTKTEQDEILDYKLMVYICEGTDKEKLDWFDIINIAGEKLTAQERRNAIYTGQWVTEAKKYFSKNNCPAYGMADKYMSGSPIRQEYLETAIHWIASSKNMELNEYMALHQHDTNCNEIWLYFQSVINWVKVTFPVYRKEMKSVQWGLLYNKYKDVVCDPTAFEDKIKELMEDDEVQKSSGIYEYLFDGDEKHLALRSFTPKQKRIAYEKQKGICPICKKHYDINDMEGDHIDPWSQGGKTVQENCQMLCKPCNRRKSAK